MVTCRTYSPGSENVAVVVAFPLKTNFASPPSSFSAAGFSFENATSPGPRYLDHVTVTGIGPRLRGFAPEFENHFPSSETQTVSGRGCIAAVVWCVDSPWGP